MAETETANPTLEQAFKSATEEHSPEQAETEPTEALDGSSGDTETASPPPEEEAGSASQEELETEDGDILTDEEYQAVKDDPVQLRKALNKAYTQKTQALAEERKSLEGYQMLIDAFERDPKGTLSLLNKEYGIQTVSSDEKVESAAQDITHRAVEAMKPQLGDDLANSLAPVFLQVAQMAAESAIAPLRQEQEQVAASTAKVQTDAVLEAFSSKYPDWKKHEKAMVELGQKIQPQGMEDFEFMELLYNAVTRGQNQIQTTKKVVEKMKRSTKAAQKSDSGMSDSKIAPSKKLPSLKESFDAAVEGVRFEH